MEKKIVLIEFDDPCHDPGWSTDEESAKPKDLRCLAVGFEVERTNKLITIAEAIAKHDPDEEDKLNKLTLRMENVKNIKTLVPKTIKKKNNKKKTFNIIIIFTIYFFIKKFRFNI